MQEHPAPPGRERRGPFELDVSGQMTGHRHGEPRIGIAAEEQFHLLPAAARALTRCRCAACFARLPQIAMLHHRRT